MTSQLPAPSSFDQHTLVEYVEIAMLVEDIEHMSIAELANRFPAGQRPDAAELGLIRAEVRRRQDLLGDLYPYRADSEGIARVVPRSNIYDFLALISLEWAPFRQRGDAAPVNRVFDLLVREALKAHLGAGSDAVRFGTPVNDGRPQDFPAAVSWLAASIGVPDGQLDRPTEDKDGGVDIVAWHHFGDHRAGFPVVLAQATTQLNFELKVGRIPVEAWKRWIDIGPRPQTALAIPFTVQVGDDRWMKVTTETSLFLDRIRICELLKGVDLAQLQPEWDELQSYVQRAKIEVIEFAEDDEAHTPRVAKPRRQRPSEDRDLRRR